MRLPQWLKWALPRSHNTSNCCGVMISPVASSSMFLSLMFFCNCSGEIFWGMHALWSYKNAGQTTMKTYLPVLDCLATPYSSFKNVRGIGNCIYRLRTVKYHIRLERARKSACHTRNHGKIGRIKIMHRNFCTTGWWHKLQEICWATNLCVQSIENRKYIHGTNILRVYNSTVVPVPEYDYCCYAITCWVPALVPKLLSWTKISYC